MLEFLVSLKYIEPGELGIWEMDCCHGNIMHTYSAAPKNASQQDLPLPNIMSNVLEKLLYIRVDLSVITD